MLFYVDLRLNNLHPSVNPMSKNSNPEKEEKKNKEIEMIPLTYHEAAELLEKLYRERNGFRLTEQRRVYEYVQKFLFTSKEEIFSLIESLEKELKVPRQIAIQIAYLLPTTPEEYEPFLIQLKRIGYKELNADEFVSKAIALVTPVWRKNLNTILTLRNINLAELGIKQKKEK